MAETTTQYDPTFNKLTYKKDANGGETTYQINGQGDVELSRRSSGTERRTHEYHYDGDGPARVDQGPARLHHVLPATSTTSAARGRS